VSIIREGSRCSDQPEPMQRSAKFDWRQVGRLVWYSCVRRFSGGRRPGDALEDRRSKVTRPDDVGGGSGEWYREISTRESLRLKRNLASRVVLVASSVGKNAKEIKNSTLGGMQMSDQARSGIENREGVQMRKRSSGLRMRQICI
jgi:hypothetical protein